MSVSVSKHSCLVQRGLSPAPPIVSAPAADPWPAPLSAQLSLSSSFPCLLYGSSACIVSPHVFVRARLIYSYLPLQRSAAPGVLVFSRRLASVRARAFLELPPPRAQPAPRCWSRVCSDSMTPVLPIQSSPLRCPPLHLLFPIFLVVRFVRAHVCLFSVTVDALESSCLPQCAAHTNKLSLSQLQLRVVAPVVPSTLQRRRGVVLSLFWLKEEILLCLPFSFGGGVCHCGVAVVPTSGVPPPLPPPTPLPPPSGLHPPTPHPPSGHPPPPLPSRSLRLPFFVFFRACRTLHGTRCSWGGGARWEG